MFLTFLCCRQKDFRDIKRMVVGHEPSARTGLKFDDREMKFLCQSFINPVRIPRHGVKCPRSDKHIRVRPHSLRHIFIGEAVITPLEKHRFFHAVFFQKPIACLIRKRFVAEPFRYHLHDVPVRPPRLAVSNRVKFPFPAEPLQIFKYMGMCIYDSHLPASIILPP